MSIKTVLVIIGTVALIGLLIYWGIAFVLVHFIKKFW